MKKPILWGLAAMLVLGLGAWLLWPAPFPIRAYDRIRLGMTASEVEAVIGEAPSFTSWAIPPDIARSELGGSWATVVGYQVVRETGAPVERVLVFSQDPTKSGRRVLYPSEGWRWPEYDIWVLYDLDGEVIGCQLIKSDAPNPSWFGRIWDWLGSWGPPPTTKMKRVPSAPRSAP